MKIPDIVKNGEFIGKEYFRTSDGRIYRMPDDELIYHGIHNAKTLTPSEVERLAFFANEYRHMLLDKHYKEHRLIILAALTLQEDKGE